MDVHVTYSYLVAHVISEIEIGILLQMKIAQYCFSGL